MDGPVDSSNEKEESKISVNHQKVRDVTVSDLLLVKEVIFCKSTYI